MSFWLMLLIAALTAVIQELMRRWSESKGLTAKEKRRLNAAIHKASMLETCAVRLGCKVGGEPAEADELDEAEDLLREEKGEQSQ